MIIEETKEYKDCKKQGYHNWEMRGVNGTLPYQEVDLYCEHCEAEHTASFEVLD